MEGIEAVGVVERVGLRGRVTVLGNLHDSQDGSIFTNAAKPDFASQPLSDGFTARLMRGDHAARVGQGGHGPGR